MAEKYTSKKRWSFTHYIIKQGLMWSWNQINFVSQDDLDELEESAWHVASVLPAIPNFVHPNLEVVLFPNGQRGVVVTASWHNKKSLRGRSAIRCSSAERFFFCLWSP